MTKLINFLRRGLLLVHDKSSWDKTGASLLQIFLQLLASGEAPAAKLEKFFLLAKEALGIEPMIESNF